MKFNTDALIIGGVTIAAVAMVGFKIKRTFNEIRDLNNAVKDTTENMEENIGAWSRQFHGQNVQTHVNPEGATCAIRDVN